MVTKMNEMFAFASSEHITLWRDGSTFLVPFVHDNLLCDARIVFRILVYALGWHVAMIGAGDPKRAEKENLTEKAPMTKY
jgi:hypothetical protein